ncbi:hypothetical protein PROFUN_10084 [Planoprotostelium fungivorum]|uniref:ER membrane protein complex subunit 1 n=1 Tax=Planoprotostelium fungivorum TaxID=1890364 RepID=A0A2P6NEX5_9EUKA|nr:hypothetical protein PROFUN_10084 [Planoprotostelium fungivorum]
MVVKIVSHAYCARMFPRTSYGIPGTSEIRTRIGLQSDTTNKSPWRRRSIVPLGCMHGVLKENSSKTIQNVGTPSNAIFHPQKRAVYVSTDSNVLAALSLKNGDISEIIYPPLILILSVWRRVFDLPTGRLIQKGNVLLLTVNLGRELYLLDNTEGSVLWNLATGSSPTHHTDHTFLGDIDGDGIEDLASLLGDVVQLRSGRDGNLVWKSQIQGGEGGSLTADATSLYVIRSDRVFKLDIKSGQVVESSVEGKKGKVEAGGISQQQFWTAEGGRLYSIKLDSKQWSNHASLKGEKVSNVEINGNNVFVAAQAENQIQITSVIDGQTSTENIVLSSNVSTTIPLNKMFLNAYNTKEGKRGYRVLALFSDESLALFSGVPKESGSLEKQWNREEGLSQLNSHVIVDLPDIHVYTRYMREVGETQDGLLQGWLHRVHAQMTQLREFVSGGNGVDSYSEVRPYTDPMGFRKMIIGVSRAGKLFGIQTDSSTVVWSNYLGPERCGQPKDLVVVRKSSHFPPSCLLICSNEKKTDLIWFNPLDGTNLTVQHLPIHYKRYITIPLSVVEEEKLGDQRLISLIDDDNRIHSLSPPSVKRDISDAVLTSRRPITFWHVAELNESIVRGYTVGQQTRDHFESEEVWSVPLGSHGKSEKIVSAAYVDVDNAIASAARILGNRDALPKYLNRNLFAVATESSTSIGIYLIDGVTGSIVHSTVVPSATGPVHMKLVENWLVFTYFNLRHNRHEVSVVELFEQKLDWKEVDSNRTKFSSYQHAKPAVLQQTYILPVGISDITSTITVKGITPKQLLFATTSDQILAYGKNFLDPRRPPKEKITPEDREEGLWPYDPALPFSPRSVITYHRQVKKIKSITTHPSNLESTSVVLAVGLDLFFTRTAAANSFDVLNPDFNFFALILTTGGLLVATVFSIFASRKADLSRLWK